MYQCSCCYSSETGLDKLWPRVHDVVSRAMTLWADEHLREPAWANADTAGIVIKSRAISDSIWHQPGATVWTKLISKLHSARTIWYSSNWIDCTNIAIRISIISMNTMRSVSETIMPDLWAKRWKPVRQCTRKPGGMIDMPDYINHRPETSSWKFGTVHHV